MLPLVAFLALVGVGVGAYMFYAGNKVRSSQDSFFHLEVMVSIPWYASDSWRRLSRDKYLWQEAFRRASLRDFSSHRGHYRDAMQCDGIFLKNVRAEGVLTLSLGVPLINCDGFL